MFSLGVLSTAVAIRGILRCLHRDEEHSQITLSPVEMEVNEEFDFPIRFSSNLSPEYVEIDGKLYMRFSRNGIEVRESPKVRVFRIPMEEGTLLFLQERDEGGRETLNEVMEEVAMANKLNPVYFQHAYVPALDFEKFHLSIAGFSEENDFETHAPEVVPTLCSYINPEKDFWFAYHVLGKKNCLLSGRC